MPIDTADAGLSENYCAQLQALIAIKLQALWAEFQPMDVQWNYAVEAIDVLVDNLLIEETALEDVQHDFQVIRDAIDGKSNEVREEALNFLSWRGVNIKAGDLEPVALFLNGRLENARRDVENYTASRDEAQEFLWAAIDGLRAELIRSQGNATPVPNGPLTLNTMSASPAPDPRGDSTEMEWFTDHAGPDEVGEATDCAVADGMEIVVVGAVDAVDADSLSLEKSPGL